MDVITGPQKRERRTPEFWREVRQLVERGLSLKKAMLAIKAISNQLYGWDREPDLQRMKLAHKGGDERPTAAVNLSLIGTSPQELAAMAKAKSDHSGDHVGDHVGDHNGDYSGDHSCDRNLPFATKCNAQGMGPSVVAPQQPSAATHGRPIPQKEAPPLPVNQPVLPRRETAAQPPTPLSPQERRRQELEELARLRKEWRGGGEGKKQ